MQFIYAELVKKIKITILYFVFQKFILPLHRFKRQIP